MHVFLFYRSMLAAAQVLAVDAKHLLDAVDSIRLRFPILEKALRLSLSLDRSQSLEQESS